MMKFSAIYNEIYGARHIKVNWNNFCTVYHYFRAAKCYWISVFCYWNFHEIQTKILKFVLISQLFLHENTDICIKICKDIEIIVNCFWSKFLEVGRPELLNVVKFMCMHFFCFSGSRCWATTVRTCPVHPDDEQYNISTNHSVHKVRHMYHVITQQDQTFG